MKDLMAAPLETPLRIIEIAGGEGVRRRLSSLGFFTGDMIERGGQGILRGPLLIKNLKSGVTVAVGRGIAQKIMVETVDGRE